MQPFPRTREEALGAVAQELRSEQASALGRIGRRLERLIDQLHGLRQTLASLEGPGRGPLVEVYGEVHREAELYLWYLRVQREAMGITLNGELESFYPIPPAIRQ